MAASENRQSIIRLSLFRYLARHLLIGVLAGEVFLGLLMALDVDRLRLLVLASDMTYLALFLLANIFAVTFGGLSMAVAAMMLEDVSAEQTLLTESELRQSDEPAAMDVEDSR